MEIFVNDKKMDFELQGETAFGEVWSGLESWVKEGDKRIWSVIVNGKPYPVDAVTALDTMPVQDITSIELSIGEKKPGAELRKRAESLRQAMPELKSLATGIAERIHTGKVRETAEDWHTMLILVGKFYETLPYFASLHTDDTDIVVRIGRYKEILKEMLSCMDLADNVSLCDQLEYEFAPMVDEWSEFLKNTSDLLSRGN